MALERKAEEAEGTARVYEDCGRLVTVAVADLSKVTHWGKRPERMGEYPPSMSGTCASIFRSCENFARGVARRCAHAISTRHPIGDLDSAWQRDISWHVEVGSFLRLSD